MSSAIPYPEILTASLKGVDNAFKKYHKWSGNLWLDWAPESFIQAEIVNSLSKICPCIRIEESVKYILEGANAELRGPKPRNSKLGRVDIVILRADETPRILIEVKKAWRSNALSSDANRLRKLLNRGGRLENGKGLLVAYTSSRKPDTIVDRFEDIADNSGTTLENWIGPKNRIGETGYWGAGCFSVDM